MRALAVVLVALLASCIVALEEWPFDSAGRSINIKDGEFRVPLYEWTYNEGKQFKSAYNGKRYRVPDTMDVVDNSDILFTTYKSNLGNLTETKKQLKKWSGWSFGLPFLGIHSAKRSATVQNLLKDGKSELFMVQKDLGVFQVGAWSNPKLSSRFLNKVAALPLKYNAKAYADFLEYAGTHYFTTGEFGGQLIVYVKVQEQIYKYMKKTEVSRQVGAYVSALCVKLGFTSGAEKSALKVSETFKTYSKAVCELSPGNGVVTDCEKLTGNTYKQWVNTILTQPTLLTPRVEPLHNILYTPSIGSTIKNLSTIRSNIATGIKDYLKSPKKASRAVKHLADAEFAEFVARESRKRTLAEVGAFGINEAVPGMRYLGMGYDAVTDEYRVLPIVALNFTGSNNNNCDFQGCTSNYLSCWRDPLNRNRTYALPKGVCVSLVGTSETQVGATAYMSRDSYEKYFDQKKTTKKLFGIKKSTKHTHEYMKRFYEEDMALSVAQLWNERYKLSLSAVMGIPSPELPLNPRFLDAVKALPTTYNARAYREFILRFGTHYIHDSTFGGTLTSQDWFHRCLSYTYSDKFSSQSSSFSLLIISKKSGSFSQNAKLDAKWMEYSTSSVQFTGGNPFAFNPADYDKWLKTVAQNPAPISQTVEPLSDVVTKIDKVRGKNLLQATKEYAKEMATKEQSAQQILRGLDPQDKPLWCKGYPKVPV